MGVFEIAKLEEIARLDIFRRKRTGIPEVILAEGKSPEDCAAIARRFAEEKGYVFVTRTTSVQRETLRGAFGGSVFSTEINEKSRTFIAFRAGRKPFEHENNGTIGIITAGTSDIPVAEEARAAAEFMGCRVVSAYDVGVAGIHRIFAPLKEMLESGVAVIIVIAGMEGALPSVVAALVDVPVIGCPASVGYGYGGRGEAALMGMLQSCSPGIGVVNIDNGFGAAALAVLIARRRTADSEKDAAGGRDTGGGRDDSRE